MVLYELFIVSTSLMALRTGRTAMSHRIEMGSHTVSVVVGLGVFVGWTACYAPAYTNFFADIRQTVSTNDTETKALDLEQEDEITDAMNSSEMVLIRVWVAVLGVVIVLWAWSRLVLHQLELEWQEALVSANAEWDRDRKNPLGRMPNANTITITMPHTHTHTQRERRPQRAQSFIYFLND